MSLGGGWGEAEAVEKQHACDIWLYRHPKPHRLLPSIRPVEEAVAQMA